MSKLACQNISSQIEFSDPLHLQSKKHVKTDKFGIKSSKKYKTADLMKLKKRKSLKLQKYPFSGARIKREIF